MPADADYRGAREYLLGLKSSGVKLGLERMQALVAQLGHPERATPCVHIAGTNGKGSVAAMVDVILRASGKRVGLYTSPHLVRLGERVQVDRQSLRDDEITRYVGEMKAAVEAVTRESGEQPSYFEFMTALAFLHFARMRCEVAVIETGMGGRIDATNVVTPEVAVITSIGLDHAEFLGGTIEAIAVEKAGIVKPGRPVVIGRMPSAAETVVRRTATERGAHCISVNDVFGPGRESLPATNLVGEHQRWNAATALLATRCFSSAWNVDTSVAARALQHVEWPGRWQELRASDRRVILDAAHNAEGGEALAGNLARLARESGALRVVVGVLGAARAKPLLAAVCPHAAAVHLVVPRQRRACSQQELEALLPTDFGGTVRREDVARIFPGARECVLGEPGDTIVVTGSIYLVGEVLARLEPERGELETELQDF